MKVIRVVKCVLLLTLLIIAPKSQGKFFDPQEGGSSIERENEGDDFQSRWEDWNTRRMADIEAAKQELLNAKQDLLNAGIYVNLQLKIAYLNAYQNYVSVYANYLSSLATKYRQMDHVREALMWSVTQVRKFQQQSNICTSMTRRMWQRSLPEATIDTFETQIYVSNIGRILRSMASRDHGEACVNKVLLEHEAERLPIFGAQSELLSLRYVNRSSDPAAQPALICPSDDAALAFNPATDRPVDNYPLMTRPDANGRVNYYVPFTYFQLYTLLSDHSTLFEIAPPPTSAAPICNSRLVNNTGYLGYSHTAETGIALAFDLVNDGTVSEGIFVRQLDSAHGNRAYQTLINTTKTIFEKIYACIAANTSHTPPPPPLPGPDGFDPAIPSANHSLQQCFGVAEGYRQLAFSNEEIVAQIIRTLAESQVEPPKEPSRPDTGQIN